MKPLPPSMREKKRYLKLRIHSEEGVEFGELVEEIWDALLDHLGAKGAGEANIWIIKNLFDKESQEAVIKVRKDMEDDVRTALTLIDGIGERGFVEVTAVSGSVKKLE